MLSNTNTDNLPLFNTIQTKLLNPLGQDLRHIPLKIYLPTAVSAAATITATTPQSPTADPIPEEGPRKQIGHIRVVQSLIPLLLPSKQPQTLGTALNSILPTIFPSRRNPLLAQPVLHGVVVPMAAPIEDLGRAATYADGFLHVAVVMLA